MNRSTLRLTPEKTDEEKFIGFDVKREMEKFIMLLFHEHSLFSSMHEFFMHLVEKLEHCYENLYGRFGWDFFEKIYKKELLILRGGRGVE